LLFSVPGCYFENPSKIYVSESFSLKKLLEELAGELSIGVLTTDRSGAIKVLMRYRQIT
jgi:hypothetical protein